MKWTDVSPIVKILDPVRTRTLETLLLAGQEAVDEGENTARVSADSFDFQVLVSGDRVLGTTAPAAPSLTMACSASHWLMYAEGTPSDAVRLEAYRRWFKEVERCSYTKTKEERHKFLRDLAHRQIVYYVCIRAGLIPDWTKGQDDSPAATQAFQAKRGIDMKAYPDAKALATQRGIRVPRQWTEPFGITGWPTIELKDLKA